MNKQSCKFCGKKLLCEKAQKVKELTGDKLDEMWFSCYEPNERSKRSERTIKLLNELELSTSNNLFVYKDSHNKWNLCLNKKFIESHDYVYSINKRHEDILSYYISHNYHLTIPLIEVECESSVRGWKLVDDWIEEYDESKEYRIMIC